METKFCKDCKHMSLGHCMSRWQGTAMCHHPLAPVDPVFGEKNGTCDLMRSTNCLIEHCGADSLWFEQAPPAEPAGQWVPAPEPEPAEQLGFWESLFDSLRW
jgi:hypothetical protein